MEIVPVFSALLLIFDQQPNPSTTTNPHRMTVRRAPIRLGDVLALQTTEYPPLGQNRCQNGSVGGLKCMGWLHFFFSNNNPHFGAVLRDLGCFVAPKIGWRRSPAPDGWTPAPSRQSNGRDVNTCAFSQRKIPVPIYADVMGSTRAFIVP